MEDTSAFCCANPEKSVSSRLPAWATRNRLMMTGGAVVVGGMAFNWGWLTAIGVAPILLAVAPCGIMCALGLCMMGMKKTPDAPATVPTDSSTE
jgi:hypothetical protein